jgi:acyl-coenzyme A synthetase/AMP-(fatty) acid ligase
VESALIEHDAVLESAVVPSPDVERGQVVKAFVVLAEKFSEVRGVPEREAALIAELQVAKPCRPCTQT